MGADGTLVDLQEYVGKRLAAMSHRDRASSHVMTWKSGGGSTVERGDDFDTGWTQTSDGAKCATA